jgi:hypothetical protein
MNPLLVPLITALISAGPDMLAAVAAIINAAHGRPTSEADHTAIGRAIAAVLAKSAP